MLEQELFSNLNEKNENSFTDESVSTWTVLFIEKNIIFYLSICYIEYYVYVTPGTSAADHHLSCSKDTRDPIITNFVGV